jgi:hypothetical protein
VEVDRGSWLLRVGDLTRAHRERRALGHERQAAMLRRARQRDPAAVPVTTPRWHEGRANGHRHRVERVTRCHTDAVLVRSCRGCGVESARMLSCGSTLLCRSCRSRAGARLRARFDRARTAALDVVRRSGLLVGFTRWSEKFVTLTVPHMECGERVTAERRVRLLESAWTIFLRTIRSRGAFQRERGVDPVWYRVTEWTPGSDGWGHPHIHLWALCPWLDRAWLLGAWRAALAAAGYRWDEGQQPVIDVRAVRERNGRTSDRLASELVKYMTKDLHEGALVDPALFALVYQLYDGKRRTQGARGFMARGESARSVVRCSCGADTCDVWVVPQGAEGFEVQRRAAAEVEAARSRERLARLAASRSGVA